MAYYGLSKPVIAQLDPTTDTYTNGMELGKLAGTTVTPQSAEGSLYLDNALSEYKKKFTKANVEVETGSVSLQAGKILFGHTVATDEETSNTSDESGYVGYGFVGMETINGVDSFTACWLTKVKFAEGEDSYQTEGENITFNTQKISGEAIGNNDGVWRIKKKFKTEADAYAYLKEKAGIE